METDTITAEAAELRHKYSSVIVADGHQERLGKKNPVLLLDTPTAVHAIAPHASENVAVTGLFSPNSWRDSSGAKHQEIIDLGQCEEVVIAFDTAKDPEAHTQAAELGEFLSNFTPVRFVKATGDPLAAELAGLPENKRAEFLAGKIAKAGKTLGAKPRPVAQTRSASLGSIVDVNRAEILSPARPGSEEIVWLPAAVERIGESLVWNDLADPGRRRTQLWHDLRVHIAGVDRIIRAHDITDVSSAALSNPRAWLDRVPGGSSVSPNPAFSHSERQIAAAMRAHAPENVVSRTILTRSGWFEHDGQWGYVTGSGLLTAAGMVGEVRSELAEMHRAFTMEDSSSLTPEEELDAALTGMTTLAHLGDPTIRVALMGLATYSVGALAGRGRGSGCVVNVLAKPGSGKSTILGGFYRTFFAPNAPGVTLLASSSAAVQKAAYPGMDSGIVVADDFKTIVYDDRDTSDYGKLNALIRPGYEGGAAGAAKSIQDSDGRWIQPPSDPASPAIIIGSETLPIGAMSQIHSTLERLFVVEITSATAFASGTASDWQDATGDPRNHQHLSAFVRWVARKIDEAGSLPAYRAPWLAMEREEVARLRSLGPEFTARVAQTSTVPLIGTMLWTAYLVETGALTETERIAYIDSAREIVTAAGRKHGLRISGGGAAHDIILDAVRSAMNGQRVHVGAVGETPVKATYLGGHKDLDGQKCVVLLVDELLRFLRTDERWRNLGKHELTTALKPVALPGKDGSTIRKQRMPQISPTYVIPLDVFGDYASGA